MKTPSQKAAIVAQVREHLAEGWGLRAACRKAGTSPASFGRWDAALEEAGGDPWAAFEARKPTGRPPSIELTLEEADVCRWHRLTKNSLDAAVYFAVQDERLSPELRQRLQEIHERALEAEARPNFPPSVRRAFHVTTEERARFRGKKARQSAEMVAARGLFWIDEDGESHDLLPGHLWELDDYSANQPYTWTDPATGEANLGRQVLAAMDVASAGWLGFDHIGRERDAYRGEDIVRTLGRLFRQHGVPLFLRLERGSWESSYVHGLEVDGLSEPWGALDAIVRIHHVWSSKAKGLIESSFNPLQTWLSHTGTDVGRFRGEFEAGTKRWLQAKRSGRDPLELGFLSADASASLHAEAARLMNSRPRQRRALGRRVAPDDLRAELGWNTSTFPEAEAWRLLPYRERRVVDGGFVNVNPGGGWPRLSFMANGIEELHLDNGHAVLIAYDPAHPELGAYIANADRSHRNRAGWPMAHPLLTAPLYAEGAQVDLSGRYLTGGVGARKKASAAVATSFRGIVGPGKQGGREVLVANGGDRTARAGDLDQVRPPAAPEPGPGERPAPLRPAAIRGMRPEPSTDRGGEDRLAALDRASRKAAETL